MPWSTSPMPPSPPGCALPSPSDALLEVRDLRVSFRTERGLLRAVGGVSFRIEPREIVGVVGESGSGKTVALMTVMGLIHDPNIVVEGSVVYKGRELVGLTQRR